MSFYSEWILPRLIHLSMRQRKLTSYRRRVIGEAGGRVLEIGVGSGINLPLYTENVEQVVALDPSPQLLELARTSSGRAPRPVQLVQASAEAIPLRDKCIDTVVTTWTLCTIPDARRALLEMHRVLRKEGQLLFVEHGLSPDAQVRNWQDRLTPAWRRVGGGCHLNRPIDELIESGGFRIERLDTGYMNALKPMTFMYEGIARPAPPAPQRARDPRST